MRLFDELAGDYTWLRGRLEKQVGSLDTDVLAGFQGPTATGSTGLLRQVKLAADALSVAELTSRGPSRGVRVRPAGDRREAAGQGRARTASCCEELRRLKRELEVSQKEKDRTVERHKKTFFPIARTIEDFYRLAGEDELAEKVRPSVAQRGRRAIEVEGSPEGGRETEGPADGAARGGVLRRTRSLRRARATVVDPGGRRERSFAGG